MNTQDGERVRLGAVRKEVVEVAAAPVLLLLAPVTMTLGEHTEMVTVEMVGGRGHCGQTGLRGL